MKYIITMTLATTLYILIIQMYKLACVQDTVEVPLDYFKGGEVA